MGIVVSDHQARKKRVAFVTIGQTPRDDIVPGLLEQIATEVDYAEIGALDGLDARAIAKVGPQDGDDTLYTRLKDGAETRIGKQWLTNRLQAIVEEIDRANFDLIVLLCTSAFDDLSSRTPMIDAQVEIDPLYARGGRLGVIFPAAEQIEEVHGARYGDGTYFGFFSPHSVGDRDDELRTAAEAVAKSQIVVMDCMAFDDAIRSRLQSKISRPVILARDLLAEKIAHHLG